MASPDWSAGFADCNFPPALAAALKQLDGGIDSVAAEGGLPAFVSFGDDYMSIASSDAETRRLLLESRAATDSSGSCEVIRIVCRAQAGHANNDAKGAIAWYLGEDTTEGHAVAWLQAHDWLNQGTRHQHISLETSNTAGTSVNTRFGIGFGRDLVQAGFYACEVNVVANKFRVSYGAGNASVIELCSQLSDQLAPDTSHQRWQLLKNATAEGGSNAGSDFELRNYSDTGVALGLGITVLRSNGFVGVRGCSAPATAFEVGVANNTGGTNNVRLNRGTTSQFARLIFATGSSASAVAERWAMGLSNDTTNDYHFRDAANGHTPLFLETRATQGNIQLFGGSTITKSFGSGVGVLHVKPATTEPTSAPADGVLVWSFGNALKIWRAGAGAAQTFDLV